MDQDRHYQKIDEIHENIYNSWINGQFSQMRKQIDEYGTENLGEFLDYLIDISDRPFENFSQLIVCYFRGKQQ